jgi:hypothetical protein
MQLLGSLPARWANIRAMSAAVPMLLAPTNVRSPHTTITVSQFLQASAAVTDRAGIVASPSRAEVPSADPITSALNMVFSRSESKSAMLLGHFGEYPGGVFRFMRRFTSEARSFGFEPCPRYRLTAAAGATFRAAGCYEIALQAFLERQAARTDMARDEKFLRLLTAVVLTFLGSVVLWLDRQIPGTGPLLLPR